MTDPKAAAGGTDPRDHRDGQATSGTGNKQGQKIARQQGASGTFDQAGSQQPGHAPGQRHADTTPLRQGTALDEEDEV